MKRLLIAAAIALALTGLHAQQPAPRNQLLIVVDGLRPDYVTPEIMPRLAAIGRRGIVFTAHHSVFPTVTRVNASSMATGAYPETHGLMGNAIYIPSVNPTRSLDTSQHDNLEAVARAEGELLTAPSLGEILDQAGKKFFVASAGSSGSAFLLNHKVRGGGIVNTEFALPKSLADRAASLGPLPKEEIPNEPRNRYAIEAYLTIGLNEIHPDIAILWFGDPDATAHAKGVGTPDTRRALALVDAGIGRVEDTLRARGLLDRTNIVVASDHGFTTHTGEMHLSALVAPFARDRPDGSKDIVVAEGAIYLRSGNDPTRVGAIVGALQKRPEVGAIFTRPAPSSGRPGSARYAGVVPGTLSLEVARANHTRAGEILVSANWNNDKNAAGFAGTTADGGVAGHGTTSPWDVHNTLIAAGPDFREHTASDVPTANVDLAPTLLRLVGLKPAPTMTGRVIEEALRTGPAISSVRVTHVNETVRTPDGSYELTAHVSVAAGKRYLDSTAVVRR